MKRGAGAVLGMAAAFLALPALALDYRSIESPAAVFYDAPAASARKLFVVSRLYPVEVVVALGDWVKVRDVTGALAWVEKKDLGDRRTVLVTAALADVRRDPADTAPLAFRAEKDVALEVVAEAKATPGWAKVKAADGRSGFVKFSQVWGL